MTTESKPVREGPGGQTGPGGHEQSPTVLQISPSAKDHEDLEEICRSAGWKRVSADTIREAVAVLRSVALPVVICDRDLPDGPWSMLLRGVQSLATPPRLIVSSRLADPSLWSTVLRLGGFDVLSTPFDGREVRRVVAHAWESWRRDYSLRESMARAAAAPDADPLPTHTAMIAEAAGQSAWFRSFLDLERHSGKR
jgi:DNA-binding NtrC family response regulator